MSKREALEGTYHGDWYISEYIGNKRYLLKCTKCGETKEMLACNIKHGYGKLCTKKIQPVVDLTGQQIGEWTVLQYMGDKKYWCRCSCGKEGIVLKANLINGSSQSCGHSRKSYGSLIGQQFGEWTVIGKENYRYVVKCSCGKIGHASASDLVKGKTKSCGHDYFINSNDLLNKRFGHWTVIKYIGNRQYTCKCDCGTIRDISRYDLLYGKTESCGCSRGERIKETLLDSYGETSPNKVASPRTAEQVMAASDKDKLMEFIQNLGYKPTPLELAEELGLKLIEHYV